jgi:hypothetical protein
VWIEWQQRHPWSADAYKGTSARSYNTTDYNTTDYITPSWCRLLSTYIGAPLTLVGRNIGAPVHACGPATSRRIVNV